MLKLREHIFPFTVHGTILLIIAILLIATSCQKEPEPPEPDPVGDFFEELQDGLDDAGAESVTVIAVDDNIGVGEDIRRQVFQEIQAQIHELETVVIIEHPTSELEARYAEMGLIPSEGISPELAIELTEALGADALLYASIESEAPDVHIKLYAAETGAVVFAETLQAWPLPITQEAGGIDLLGMEGEETDEESSDMAGEGSEESAEDAGEEPGT